MNDVEKTLRKEICEAAHIMWLLGFAAGTSGNISAKLPDGNLLITPSGVSKRVLKPEMLIKTDTDGFPLESEGIPSVEIKLHIECYKNRKDINAVIHMHPPTATGFAAAGLSLQDCFLPEVELFLGEISLAPYAPVGSSEIALGIVPFIKGNNAVLLQNHGALTVGGNIIEAQHNMEMLENCAKIMLITRQLK
ncbi:MAG: class II aldolase/adducin family protein [Oscillospiraceae bacterium]|nr:class II aldolase/adducin family protein [Oscillospiraceae bacterium]